ncbi:MAG: bacteriophage abortive infection AbiH family protein [Myxococcales bacterium]|jgi:hypothetical protein|nr:bacteriophage abortive infection AbiH family protein [Myxococcales bacterium]
MNIIVLGNGFDLAHGLPTCYTDFLKYCRDYKRDGEPISNESVDCRYWAFSGATQNGQSGWWSDIYSGKLDQGECNSIKEDLIVGKFEDKCRRYNENCLDCGGSILSDGHGALSASCFGQCWLPEVNALLESTYSWESRLIEQGAPVHDKLRGLLIRSSSYTNNHSNLNFAELPVGLAQYAIDESEYPDTSGQTMIFPDEFQDELWELRRQKREGVFNIDYPDGIPLKDANGENYLLFLRPAIELEDENGLVQIPECNSWEYYFE